MRKAETILGIIRERGKRRLPLKQVYRQLYNPELYIRAYGKIAQNQGAMTPGSTGETVDGMTLNRINAIIEDLRAERYHWTPVRRVNIPKSNGKTRPLGVTTWRDKLLQEVLRAILESYYEPQFSDHSHGFRPGRGCHTALEEIQATWLGTVWWVEGDISQCFDRFDHQVLLDTLSEKIHDGRFIRLIANLLKAGYLEDWKFNRTLSGTPQGAIVSPVLANIYLDRLDQFIEQTLLPQYTRGKARRKNLTYQKLTNTALALRKAGRFAEAEALRPHYRQLSSQDPNDPNYRRLRFVRYADDILLGFAGPRSEAKEIKQHLAIFLKDTLKLELSESKTLITHARTGSMPAKEWVIPNQGRFDIMGPARAHWADDPNRNSDSRRGVQCGGSDVDVMEEVSTSPARVGTATPDSQRGDTCLSARCAGSPCGSGGRPSRKTTCPS